MSHRIAIVGMLVGVVACGSETGDSLGGNGGTGPFGAGGAGAAPHGGSGGAPTVGGSGGAGADGGSGGAPTVGGSGGTGADGGTGGGPECTTADRCPDPPACQTFLCSDETCLPGDDLPLGTVCEISPGVEGVCSPGSTVVFGDGSCVECIDDTQCSSPATCNLSAHQCEAPPCLNGVLDSGETDIDCGGPSCAGCVNGDSCVVATDCLSGLCDALVCASCAVNSDCAATDWCDLMAGGSCVPRKPNGQACSAGAGDECASGNCSVVGGGGSMCCNVPCDGLCASCSAADHLVAVPNGFCVSILAGTDPRNECEDYIPGVNCTTGNCAFAGWCEKQPFGTPCDNGLFCSVTEFCKSDGACTSNTTPCTSGVNFGNCESSCNEATQDCTAPDIAGIQCDEDGDGVNGTCDGTLGPNNCVGD